MWCDEAGPLVVGVVISLITPSAEGALLVPYPATLDVPYELVEHVAWLLHEHRRAHNTRWRKLGCARRLRCNVCTSPEEKFG